MKIWTSSRRDLHNALLCTALESIGEKWGKKGLAKTTPKRKKTRKREAIKQRAASHSFAPLSNLKNFVKIAEFFAIFFQNFANLPKFGQSLLNFRQISPFFRDFSKMQHFSKRFKFCC